MEIIPTDVMVQSTLAAITQDITITLLSLSYEYFHCFITDIGKLYRHSHYSETRDLGLKTCQRVKPPAEALD